MNKKFLHWPSVFPIMYALKGFCKVFHYLLIWTVSTAASVNAPALLYSTTFIRIMWHERVWTSSLAAVTSCTGACKVGILWLRGKNLPFVVNIFSSFLVCLASSAGLWRKCLCFTTRNELWTWNDSKSIGAISVFSVFSVFSAFSVDFWNTCPHKHKWQHPGNV